MAYNPYSAVNAIYKLKGQWTDANNANNTEAKNSAAEKAKEYYDQLRKNGYGDVADELTAADYTRAKAINDKWAKLSESVTNATSPVNTVPVQGSITTPVQSNAVSSVDTAVNRENEKLFALYNQEYEDLKSTNPFETETGKAILAKYDLAGLQGRDNEVASNAGANGGNIDSFAAANALRQQAALVNQGQMAALEAHQQKLDHARALLSDMGVNIDRVFTQEETAKNNDTARKSEQAAVTGYVPTEWSIQNDAFLKNFVDESGKLKAEYYNTDFQKLINDAKASGNTELANKYAILRGLKIFGNFSEYGKYLNQGDVAYIQPQKTETARQFDKNTAYQDRALTVEQADAAADRQNKLDQITLSAMYEAQKPAEPTLTAAQALAAVKRGEITQGIIDDYNYHFRTNYTVDNPPTFDGDGNITNYSGGDGTTLTDEQVKAWAEKLNNDLAEQYGPEYKAVEQTADGNYKSVGIATEYVIMSVLESDTLTDAQKQYLLINKFGISLDTINNMLKDPHYN